MFRLVRSQVVEISDLHHFLSHWSKKAKQHKKKFPFVILWNYLKSSKCPIFLDLSHYCFYFDKSVIILSEILQKTTLNPFCDSDSVTRILSDPSKRLICLALALLLVVYYGITSILASLAWRRHQHAAIYWRITKMLKLFCWLLVLAANDKRNPSENVIIFLGEVTGTWG